MTDPSALLQQIFNAGALTQQSFGPESRYYGLPLLTTTLPGGDDVRYVSRRFIPAPGSFALLQRYRVQQGDRIDVIAGTLLGNPLSYWQICDANLATEPDAVTAVPGVFIAVTLPAGVPGA
jgi:hypothetical protein